MQHKSPCYQWYPKDAISSSRVAVLTLEQEGAYRRALDFCWLTGSLPPDTDMLSRIIGKGCTPEIATVVSTMFTKSKTNRKLLIHDRLDAERTKQALWQERSARGGRRSAALKIEHEDTATDTAPVTGTAASPAVKNTTAIKSKKKTSVLLHELHAEQMEEMLTKKFATLGRAVLIRKLDEEFPAGYEFRDEQHVFNSFKYTGTTMLKAINKPAAKKPYDPMSRMRKLN